MSSNAARKPFPIDIFARYFDQVLKRNLRSVVHIGIKPSNALAVAHPEFNASFAALSYFSRMKRALPLVGEYDALAAAERDVLDRAIDSTTDAQYEAAARWLRETVGDVPASRSRKALLDAIRKQIDDDYPTATAKLRLLRFGKSGTATAWDDIETIAASVGEIGNALKTFQQACLYEPHAIVVSTATALQGAMSRLDKKARLGIDVARCNRAIEAVSRSFQRQLPTREGRDLVRGFWQTVEGLPPDEPFHRVYRDLQSWLDDDDLDKLGSVVARWPPLSDPATALTEEARRVLANQARGRISFLTGVLGELLGRKGAFRRVHQDQLERARRFAASLEGGAWQVVEARTPVRGLTSRGFQQFYDRAILLVDDQRGAVAIAFSAQFKAGDVASLDIAAQLDSDELRQMLGSLLVDGRKYRIERGVIPHNTAIVTTLAPSEEVLEAGHRQLIFVPFSVDPALMRGFVEYFLKATGKIPVEWASS